MYSLHRTFLMPEVRKVQEEAAAQLKKAEAEKAAIADAAEEAQTQSDQTIASLRAELAKVRAEAVADDARNRSGEAEAQQNLKKLTSLHDDLKRQKKAGDEERAAAKRDYNRLRGNVQTCTRLISTLARYARNDARDGLLSHARADAFDQIANLLQTRCIV